MDRLRSKRKSLGKGTLSLIFSITAIMCSFTYIGDGRRSVGAVVLNSMNIYGATSIVSIILFIISLFIGIKYPHHIGARPGKVLSIFFIALITVLTILSIS
ncbi:hypothetical protein CFOLD11_07390 [Clostridium folliculivorans]|uniref:Uncharacterized protein n=1 Tax=Clostridium folliculivorans TaxID=2886038 RepID=A0A9W6D9R1_9CLOT|nr:hypothetical protein [Clostridium folliculivorans]GKU23913.1 hypothetical protein CFOLD11_07390 [Clostridium folliculivorans]